jgi:hypothetical protein
MDKTYTVTVHHPRCEYLKGDHQFKCHKDRLDGTWFAVSRYFGCSKNYRTPEAAIYGMVADHAGTVLSIIERN